MYCETPNIILSKTLYRIMNKFGRKCVYTDGHVIYPLRGRLPSPTAVGATLDNYKDWNVLTEDGELIPIFVAVPCGKCILCREKKSKEWTTRANCETATATYPPVFVTLTYDDAYLPKDGVCKEHLQKFIKRFRENWCRMYKTERLNLRYFACAEYGSKRGRPHYHLQLWNVPNGGEHDLLALRKINACVSRSWSEPCSEEEYHTLQEQHQCYFDGRYYKKFGRIDVSPDRGNSAAYCMKYMRKPKDVPPQWTQPTFYLSSRRNGGIGMLYLNKLIDSIREQEPAITKLPLPNGTYSLPRSFKDKLFPSLSMIIPCHIRCQLVRFEKIFRVLETKSISDEFCDLIKYMRDSLREHYGQSYDFVQQSEHLYHDDGELLRIKKGWITYDGLNSLYEKMYICFVQCFDFQPDRKRLDYYIFLKDKRQEILNKCQFPDVDILFERYKILNKINKNRLREYF